MPRLSRDFDPSEHEDTTIPQGKYVLQVMRTDIKTTSAGTGEYILAQVKVLDGEYVNYTFPVMYNIVNPNEQAEKIGKSQLSNLCKALGMSGALSDTEELHAVPFIGNVGVREAKDGYPAQNTLKSCFPYNGETKAEEEEPWNN